MGQLSLYRNAFVSLDEVRNHRVDEQVVAQADLRRTSALHAASPADERRIADDVAVIGKKQVSRVVLQQVPARRGELADGVLNQTLHRHERHGGLILVD